MNEPAVSHLLPEEVAYLVPRVLLAVNMTRKELETEARDGRFRSGRAEQAWMILRAIDPGGKYE